MAAALSNFQSIPTDCPQRERRGWLGDSQLAAETMMHNFDMAGSYTSFVQMINDAQNKTNGAVSDCVPFYGVDLSESAILSLLVKATEHAIAISCRPRLPVNDLVR